MKAASTGAVASTPGAATTRRIGSPNFVREQEVALVVGGHGHDRARAVAGQHVVGDEDRDPLAVDGVDGVGTERDAGLLAVGRQPLDLGSPPSLDDIRLDLGAPVRMRQALDERDAPVPGP